jgi:DNA topoisomerase VI subunit A
MFKLPQEPDEEQIDCFILGASGHAITGDLNVLSKLNLSSDARYIIVVEKVPILLFQSSNDSSLSIIS